ncbi:hypothetical protein [Spirosoma agri]|uniref:hypothetical protein n=1 Tax=Spirosoma agri TaxID=1987381 RepID=UPI001BB05626|nr:hypothetical protein [Spirosoma agri]
MQTIKAKRKKYEPAIYAQLLTALTQVMDGTNLLRPDRETWDIEGDWSMTGTMHFVDSAYQPLFEPFADFDCRTIKIVNYGRPAVRMTFYRKHRYWLLKDRDLPILEKKARVTEYINQLIVNSEILVQKSTQMTGTKLSEAKGQLALMNDQIKAWSIVRENVADYELAISNYQREHYYCYINYKYRTKEDDFANEQVHLLNPQRDRLGTITQVRHNIVFIDTSEIRREHPYQNKEIDGFLGRFTMQSEVGRHQLYARLRPDADSIEAFEQNVSVPDPKNEVSLVKPKKGTKPKRANSSTPLFPDWE